MLLEKVAEFEQLRLKSGPLPSGAAPFTSSNSFKSRGFQSRQKAKRWNHRLSVEAQARCDSTLKASSRIAGPSTTISLGTARPDSRYYPWESIDIRGVNIKVHEGGQTSAPRAWMSCTSGEKAYDLAVAMNYGYAAGSPQLVRFITEHVELVHKPPYSDWETSLTCGTTSALEMVFRMLCNRGDCILTEEYTYSGAVEAAKPLGLEVVGVRMDASGLVPDDLESKLRNWDSARSPKPSVLYTIPTGQNPTGGTQSTERRKAIYEIAEHHDLIVIEDDPYYFLQLEEDLSGLEASEKIALRLEKYMRELLPSYLSLDTSGRVLRLDTTSKILAPGLRLGWITGSFQLIAKFLNHTEFSTTSPSGPSQVMMYKLLDETWGHVGFINWLMYLSSQYSRRLRTMTEACMVHLPVDICRWTAPTFGMFVWIQIDWRKHPSARQDSHIDGIVASRLEVEGRIYMEAKQNGVQVSKGSWFATKMDSRAPIYFRLTFAAASEESLEQAIVRFGRALRMEFLLNDAVEGNRESCNVLGRQIVVGA